MSRMEELLKSLTAQLDVEIDKELADPNILPQHHGRPIGYNNGCKGPLCRKSQRDRMRAKGGTPHNPLIDEYLEYRLSKHQESLKQKKEKVA